MDFLTARKALLARPEGIYWRIFSVGLILTLLLALLSVYRPEIFRFIDAKIYDTSLRTTQFGLPSTSSQRPVIVDIDERSLSQVGQWPWPRHRLAALLDAITALHPASVAVDIVFPEPDRSSWERAREAFARDYGITLPLTEVPTHLLDNDVIFAKALARGPSVLAYGFLFSEQGGDPAACDPDPVADLTIQSQASAEAYNLLFHANAALCSIEPLRRSASASGFINATPDQDGVLRRMPLVIAFQGNLYPNLALRAVMQAKGVDRLSLALDGNRLQWINLGDTVLPVDEKGHLQIRFQANVLAYDRISAVELLQGRVQREQIQGRVVLLGTTAMGLETYHTSPLGDLLPGIAMYATVVENLLNHRFFAQPGWARGVELLVLAACGVLSALLMSATGSLFSFGILGTAAAGLWIGAGWLLAAMGVFVSPLFPLMALGLNFSLLSFLKYRQKEQVLRQRNLDLVNMQNFTIQCLATLAETRDSETGRHIIRCQHYVKALASRLAKRREFAPILTEETIDLLHKSAPLHDIGKIGVPDRVLLKPGRLTDEEYEEMKRHTLYGQEAIERAERTYGQEVKESFLQFGKEMAGAHHEWWNGGGYPHQLRGREIPLSGRIMAIVDVYDALICRRRYKPAFTHEEAVVQIERGKGVHFDPLLVEVFVDMHEIFRQITLTYPDDPEVEGSGLRADRDAEGVVA